MVCIGNDWDKLLKQEWEQDYYKKLLEFLDEEYRTKIVFPPKSELFNALRYTPYAEVKAVILGQDPYYRFGQAHGLCFSVKQGTAPPPSLVNIFKELHDETGVPIPKNGELTAWAKHGVLLLNTVLTVREGEPNSHRKRGWEVFTDRIIKLLNEREKPIVFMLWGSPALKKMNIITNPNHLVLHCTHPSPLSARRGFFGCGHFVKANQFLAKHGEEPIDWSL